MYFQPTSHVFMLISHSRKKRALLENFHALVSRSHRMAGDGVGVAALALNENGCHSSNGKVTRK
jgi:hypothetical protein